MSGYEAELTALRQYRDGKTPFSSDSFRQAKKSNLPERPKEVLTASKRRNSIRPAGLEGGGGEGKTTTVKSEPISLDNKNNNNEDDNDSRAALLWQSVSQQAPVSMSSPSPSLSTSASASVSSPPVSSLQYHDRLTATAQILMETLLEQGALRAQLLDAQTQSQSQRETDRDRDRDKQRGTPGEEKKEKEGEVHIRLRGTLLELEKTVQKVRPCPCRVFLMSLSSIALH